VAAYKSGSYHVMHVSKTTIASDLIFQVLALFFTYAQRLAFVGLILGDLGAKQYAIWTQVTVTVGLLIPLVSMSIFLAFLRYFPGMVKKREVSNDLFSAVVLTWLITLAVCVLGFVLRGRVSLAIFGSADYIFGVYFVLAMLFCSVSYQLLHEFYRSRNRMKLYAAITISKAIIEVVTGFLVVVCFGGGLTEFMLGLVLIQGSFVLCIGIAVICEIGFPHRIVFSGLGKYLRFSLPLIPNAILLWIINSSDRYIIMHLVGLEAVATYAASYQLGWLVSVFIVPLYIGFYPTAAVFWERGEMQKLSSYMQAALKYFLMFAIPGVIGMYHLALPILRTIAGSKFASSPGLVLLIALGACVYSINQITSYPIHLAEKTIYRLPIGVGAAALNIGLNFWLIPKWGVIAAAVSTLLSYTTRNVILLILAYRIFPFEFDFTFLIKATIAGGGMFLVIKWFSPESVLGIAGVIGLGAAVYFGMMVVVRGIGREEWILAKSAMRNLFSRT